MAWYPIHYLRNDGEGCGGAMILPEQAGLHGSDVGNLFCLRHRREVRATETEVSAARSAAHAEGWVAAIKGDLVPGTLPAAARAALFWQRALRDKVYQPGIREDAMEKAVRDGWATLQALGLAEATGHALTPAGLSMQRLVVEPEVPLGAISPPSMEACAKYAKAARRAPPKPKRAETPSEPMVCVCGCSARDHAGRRGYDGPPIDVPCPAHRCKRYVQAKPEKATA